MSQEHRTRLTKATWDKIVEAFRKHPAKFSQVGRIAWVDERTAKKAWHEGLPYEWGKKPIRELIEEEMRAARQTPPPSVTTPAPVKPTLRAVPGGLASPPAPSAGLAGGGTPATGVKARDRAVAARVEEAALVEVARSEALTFAASMAQIVHALGTVGPRLAAALKVALLPRDKEGKILTNIPRDAKGEPIPDLTIALYDNPAELLEDTKAAVALYREVLGLHRTSVLSTERVFALDRRLLGGGGKDGDEEWTPEQAQAEINRLLQQNAQKMKGLEQIASAGGVTTQPVPPAAPEPPPVTDVSEVASAGGAGG